MLIDDPAATVGVGPNAWLVQVQSSADWVGTYMYDGGTCTVGCGWCMQGQSLCHGGFDENMYPECPFCFDGDVENPGEQCAEWIAACAPAGPDGGGGGTGADGGGDGTGGADETGGTDPDETSGLEAYDCDAWQPSRAVDLNPGSGTLVVDAELVREIAQHFGDPLTECDDTAFAQLADGHFAIRRTAPNGLLAQLGLRPGDSILALDGKDMSDVDTIATTAVRLFLGKEQTRGFTLTYGRDRAKAQLRIVVR